MLNPFSREVGAYQQTRPEYPPETLRQVFAEVGADSGLDIVDIGAGTGKLTRLLRPEFNRVIAVEPAPAMLAQLRREDAPFQIVQASAEDLPLPDNCADLVTFGQCWHWLDAPQASLQARRIMREGGVVAIIFNQLDVSVPWVHRLSRIMRSGDVHRVDKAPQLGAGFTQPQLHLVRWSQPLETEDVLALARTRASYLRSDADNRVRMQANLRWYLYEHLGYQPGSQVLLPYQTLTWLSRLGDAESFGVDKPLTVTF